MKANEPQWMGLLNDAIRPLVSEKKRKRWCNFRQFLVPVNSGAGCGLSEASITDQSSISDLVNAESCCRNWRVSSPASGAKQAKESYLIESLILPNTCVIQKWLHTPSHTSI